MTEPEPSEPWWKSLPEPTVWERITWWIARVYDDVLTVVSNHRHSLRWKRHRLALITSYERPSDADDWERDPAVWHRQAQHFGRAAKLQYEEDPMPPVLYLPTYLLIGHAYELALKGFLLGKGYPLYERSKPEGCVLPALASSKIGHDLDVLAAEAKKCGLVVELSEFGWDAISHLNQVHATYGNRYPSSRSMVSLPDARSLIEDLFRLLEGTKSLVSL